MKHRLAVSLTALALLASGSASAQSTTAAGTVETPVGASVEIPNAVITSVKTERDPSMTIQEPVVVGKPLPAAVEVRPVPGYTDYRYAVVNEQRMIVEPRTRRVIRVID